MKYEDEEVRFRFSSNKKNSCHVCSFSLLAVLIQIIF
jgi:hypothetical protein